MPFPSFAFAGHYIGIIGFVTPASRRLLSRNARVPRAAELGPRDGGVTTANVDLFLMMFGFPIQIAYNALRFEPG